MVPEDVQEDGVVRSVLWMGLRQGSVCGVANGMK